jgi:HPt (histidine-containing phosphotransfer) domain-containing protein
MLVIEDCVCQMCDEIPGLAANTVRSLRELGGEDLLRRLVTMLLELAPQRLSAMRDGLRQGDLPAARGAAHALRSTVGAVGATSLLAAAQRVETAAGWTDILASASLLEREWNRLQPPLRHWLDTDAEP